MYPVLIAGTADADQIVTFNNCVFEENEQLQAPGTGFGVVNILNQFNKVSFNNCVFQNNSFPGLTDSDAVRINSGLWKHSSLTVCRKRDTRFSRSAANWNSRTRAFWTMTLWVSVWSRL